MMDRLVEILRARADAWEVLEETRECWEFYFIGRRLDQNRVRNVTHTRVNVYKELEEGKWLGSAGGEIAPTLTETEIEQQIDRLLQYASYVKNPAYTLAPGAGQVESDEVDIEQIAGDVLRTVGRIEDTGGERINSYELFVSRIVRRYRSSTGADVHTVYPRTMLEIVVNARHEEQEIELYRMYTMGTCDGADLEARIRETMQFGRDKLRAEKTPTLREMDVVFSTEAAVPIYEWFIDHMSAGAVYQKLSDWKTGTQIPPACREKITVEAVASLPHSSQNTGIDDEGSVLRSCALIRDNMALCYFGSRQFSQYLGLTDSFKAVNFAVSGGTETPQALRTGDFIEVVEFSDFQVDAITGDIAGEIRLGYLHQGGQVIPVSGGSVSGNMGACAAQMRYSQNQRQYDTMLIPAVTRLPGLTVTGAQ